MRGREFVMKDAYSFDASDEQAEVSYMKMYEAYRRIFTRCGLTFRAVQADSGAIGGNFSHEFMVLAKTGEDTIVVCTACEYAANMEKAEVKLAAAATARGHAANRQRSRPPANARLRRSATFSAFPPSRLIKTLVYLADGKPVAVLVRGDREVEEVKLKNLLKVADVELADDKQIFDATGVPTGYLGPVGIAIRVVADQEIAADAQCRGRRQRKELST